MRETTRNTTIRAIAVIVGLAAWAGLAQGVGAQTGTGVMGHTSTTPPLYLGITASHSAPADSSVTQGMATKNIGIERAAAGIIRIGKGADNGFRGEIEFAARAHDVEPGSHSILAGGPLSGEVNTMSLMTNLVWAHRIGKLRPYIGGGLGFARHEVDISTRGGGGRRQRQQHGLRLPGDGGGRVPAE